MATVEVRKELGTTFMATVLWEMVSIPRYTWLKPPLPTRSQFW